MSYSETNLSNVMSCDAYLFVDGVANYDFLNVKNYLNLFEQQYSRFIKNNFLEKYNNGTWNKPLPKDFIEMLNLAKHYKQLTNGTFDINLLKNIISEGYAVSKHEGFYKKTEAYPSSLVNNVDLGGIGKGFALDKCAKMLKKVADNYCIEIGGDMYLGGVDSKNNYPYWAIEVENPFLKNQSLATLIVSNKAIATSGTYNRNWKVGGTTKNHIIDPTTGKSLSNDLLSVTVVADSAVDADIMAKSLLIMGKAEAIKFCEQKGIAALIYCNSKETYYSSKIDQYVWKN